MPKPFQSAAAQPVRSAESPRYGGGTASVPGSRRGSYAADSSSQQDDCSITKPTLLQPRVAAVLGVPKFWQKALFACRLLSIAPAVWWGLPNGVRVLALLLLLFDWERSTIGAGGNGEQVLAERRLRLVETSLATIWCGAAAYLSFIFTDCLMSRWLVNYTPQATVVRLLTINALNAYLTSWVLYLTGGSENIHLLLPAWISIATTLTVIYHITQRKINIRKETSISISVFSLASYTSMLVLLAQLHSTRADFPTIPLLSLARTAYREAGRIALLVLEYSNRTREEL